MLGDTGETDATKKKTNVKQNSNNTLNVLFRETQHNYNVNQGKVTKALEDGVYINGTNVAKGLSRLLSYNDTICNNLYDNYMNSTEQLVVEKFGQDYYEHESDPDFIRIVREETNNYIDTLVGYIDDQEMKNLFLSYKTNEGYSKVSVECEIKGERLGESMYPSMWPHTGGDYLTYNIYIRLRQFDTENHTIKEYKKSVNIEDHFGVVDKRGTDSPAIRLVLSKNFLGNMEENSDESALSNDDNIKFVLNNEEYSNGMVGIFKYLMDSIGVEVNIDDFKESSYYESPEESVDCYYVNITEDEMNRIDQAFPY